MQVVLVRTSGVNSLIENTYPKEYNDISYEEDLEVAYLAVYLKQVQIECKIMNCQYKRVTEEEIAQESIQLGCHLYVLCVQPYAFAKTEIKVASEIKKRDKRATVILVGQMMNDMQEEVMKLFPFIDFMIEGEQTSFTNLVRSLLKGEDYKTIPGLSYRTQGIIISNTPQAKSVEGNDSVFPYRYAFEEDWPVKPYHARIEANRRAMGCNKEVRDAAHIVEEMWEVYSKYGIKVFSLAGFDLIRQGEKGRIYAEEIADLILQKRMDVKFSIVGKVNNLGMQIIKKLKKAGLYKVFLEEGSTLNLKNIEWLEDLGIEVEVGFVMIFPYITLTEIKRKLAFVKKMKHVQPEGLGARFRIDLQDEQTKQLEREGTIYGNILEKRYFIEDEQVMSYYKIWASLYKYISPILNKIRASEVRFLWDEKSTRKLYQVKEQILSAYIFLLEEGITLIERGRLKKETLGELEEKMKEFINKKTVETKGLCY